MTDKQYYEMLYGKRKTKFKRTEKQKKQDKIYGVISFLIGVGTSNLLFFWNGGDNALTFIIDLIPIVLTLPCLFM